jgi:hypothetical protein
VIIDHPIPRRVLVTNPDGISIEEPIDFTEGSSTGAATNGQKSVPLRIETDHNARCTTGPILICFEEQGHVESIARVREGSDKHYKKDSNSSPYHCLLGGS